MTYNTEKVVSFFLGMFTLWFYNSVVRYTHKSMMENFARYKPILKTTYKQFKNEFEQAEWTWDSRHRDSLFQRQNGIGEGQVHDSIYECNGKSFLLTTYGLMRARRLVKRKIKEIKLKQGIGNTFINYNEA